MLILGQDEHIVHRCIAFTLSSYVRILQLNICYNCILLLEIYGDTITGEGTMVIARILVMKMMNGTLYVKAVLGTSRVLLPIKVNHIQSTV